MSAQAQDQNIPAAQPQSRSEKVAPAPAQPQPAAVETPRAPAPVGYSVAEMSSARWQPGLATFAYVGAIFVFFALSVTQIGLAGHQLKIYGYHISGWDNHHQLKSIIGLVLWTSILGTIFSITAFFLPAFVALVSLFVLSFFWIICAGVLQHAMPYRPGNCHRKPEFDHARFDRSCHQLAAMMVLSWWQWVWVSIFLVAFAVHFVRGSAENRPKRTVFGA